MFTVIRNHHFHFSTKISFVRNKNVLFCKQKKKKNSAKHIPFIWFIETKKKKFSRSYLISLRIFFEEIYNLIKFNIAKYFVRIFYIVYRALYFRICECILMWFF